MTIEEACEELKPCPFCGSTVVAPSEVYKWPDDADYLCTSCGARAPKDQWNRRGAQDQLAAAQDHLVEIEQAAFIEIEQLRAEREVLAAGLKAIIRGDRKPKRSFYPVGDWKAIADALALLAAVGEGEEARRPVLEGKSVFQAGREGVVERSHRLTALREANDMIYLDRFLSSTRESLARYFSDHADFSGSMIAGETAAWLWFKLRQEPDSEELFPHGKWATLQRFEELLDNAALAVKDSEEATTGKGIGQ